MNRPLLERVSWIAGIIAAAVAVLAWFFPPSSTNDKAIASSKQVSVAKSDISAPPSGASTRASQNSPKVTEAPSSVPAAVDSPKCPTKAVILEALEQVRLLSSYDGRDETYSELIHDALCVPDLELAALIVAFISSSNKRDALYELVFDHAISQNQITLARTIAYRLSTTAGRDAAYKKIINASKKRS